MSSSRSTGSVLGVDERPQAAAVGQMLVAADRGASVLDRLFEALDL
jgi:hypothetical protein